VQFHVTGLYLGTGTEIVFSVTMCTFTVHDRYAIKETRMLPLQNDKKMLITLNRLEAIYMYAVYVHRCMVYSHISRHTHAHI